MLGESWRGCTSASGNYFLVRFAPEMNGWWTSWASSPRTTDGLWGFRGGARRHRRR